MPRDLKSVERDNKENGRGVEGASPFCNVCGPGRNVIDKLGGCWPSSQAGHFAKPTFQASSDGMQKFVP